MSSRTTSVSSLTSASKAHRTSSLKYVSFCFFCCSNFHPQQPPVHDSKMNKSDVTALYHIVSLIRSDLLQVFWPPLKYYLRIAAAPSTATFEDDLKGSWCCSSTGSNTSCKSTRNMWMKTRQVRREFEVIIRLGGCIDRQLV